MNWCSNCMSADCPCLEVEPLTEKELEIKEDYEYEKYQERNQDDKNRSKNNKT